MMTTTYRSFVAQFGESVPVEPSLYEDMDDLTWRAEGDREIYRRFSCGWLVTGKLVMPSFRLSNGDDAWQVCVGRAGNRRDGAGQPEHVRMHRTYWVGYDEWIAAGKPAGPGTRQPYEAKHLVLRAVIGDSSCPARREIEALRMAIADLKAACGRKGNGPAYHEARRLAFDGVEAAIAGVVRHIVASMGLPKWLIEPAA